MKWCRTFQPAIELVKANVFQSLSYPTDSLRYKPSHPPVAKLILVVGLGRSAVDLLLNKYADKVTRDLKIRMRLRLELDKS
jgi:hypothetical protein